MASYKSTVFVALFVFFSFVSINYNNYFKITFTLTWNLFYKVYNSTNIVTNWVFVLLRINKSYNITSQWFVIFITKFLCFEYNKQLLLLFQPLWWNNSKLSYIPSTFWVLTLQTFICSNRPTVLFYNNKIISSFNYNSIILELLFTT